ncbi:hypothetical protein [Paenibacillus sp. GXUN7292]|uniref:hypothetical protein n=1 Tax=Paenibacillus sp. GXUN7292 TaxID=3422499 RepID=UPI003D7DB7C8
MIYLLVALGSVAAVVVLASVGALLGVPVLVYYLKGSLDNARFRKVAAGFYALVALITVISIVAFLVSVLVFIPTGLWILFSGSPISSIESVAYVLMGIATFYSVLFSFYYVAFTVSHNKRPDLIGLQYEKYGRLRNWSRATNAFRKEIGWTERFVTRAIEAIQACKDDRTDPIVIIGPSANSGVIEDILARRTASALERQVHMYASDMTELPSHIEDYSEDGVEYRYTSGIEAADLKKTYPFQADVIFDNKGILWHKANSSKKKVNVQEIMSTYYDLLKPGGIVIVDGYIHKNQGLLTMLNQFQLQLLRRISWFAEKSTYAYFSKMYQSDPELKKLFKEVIIPDGLYTVVYYQKL